MQLDVYEEDLTLALLGCDDPSVVKADDDTTLAGLVEFLDSPAVTVAVRFRKKLSSASWACVFMGKGSLAA